MEDFRLFILFIRLILFIFLAILANNFVVGERDSSTTTRQNGQHRNDKDVVTRGLNIFYHQKVTKHRSPVPKIKKADKSENFTKEIDMFQTSITKISMKCGEAAPSSSVKLETGETEDLKKQSCKKFSVAGIWNFECAGFPLLITVWLILGILAKIGFHYKKLVSSILPECCLPILLGLLLGTVLHLTGSANYYTMDPRNIFLFLLPAIFLDAGYSHPGYPILNNLGTILLLAVMGTLLNIVLIAATLWGFTTLMSITPLPTLFPCLVLATLLSAVESLAALPLLKKAQVNDAVYVIIFCESVFSNAVAVIIYQLLGTHSHTSDQISASELVGGTAWVVWMGLGGILIGLLFGLVTGFVSRFTGHVRLVEPLLVFGMAYLSYLTAELLHLSGILCCTFCGMTMKHYVEANISPKSRTTIHYSTRLAASVCETLILLMLGASTIINRFQWNTGFMMLILASCLIYRVIVIGALSYLVNFFRLVKLTRVDQCIMAFGGLRGAIAFSLVTLLDDQVFPHKHLYVTATLVVVYFTVFVMGMAVRPVVDLLQKMDDPDGSNLNEQLNGKLFEHVTTGLEDISGYHDYWELWDRLQDFNRKYIKPVLMRKKRFKQRGWSVLNGYHKLTEKEVQEVGSKNGSVVTPPRLPVSSLVRLLLRHPQELAAAAGCKKSDSPAMECLPLRNIDRNGLDNNVTGRMRDDSKIQHILEDATAQPRKRAIWHDRHMLSEPDLQAPVNHKARYHLRHLISHHHSNHHHSLLKKDNGNGSEAKPRKNVSFAELPEANEEDEKEEKADKVSRCDRESSSESDAGIVFTVARRYSEGDLDLLEDDASDEVIPTAAETTLPWKRNTDRDPVSSSFTHSLPDDNHPQLGEAPSWVSGESDAANLDLDIPPTSIDNGASHSDNSELDSSCYSVRSSSDQDHEQDTATDQCNEDIKSGVSSCSHNPANRSVSDKSFSIPLSSTRLSFLDIIDGGDDGLPPPWRCADNGEVHLDEQAPRDCPRKQPVPVESVVVEDSVLPPPWRQQSSGVGFMRSFSTGCELDCFSMQPQASAHSFRWSEAESKHSEPMHMPSMIQHASAPRLAREHSRDIGLDLGDDEIDVFDRVAQWLDMTVEEEPGYHEPDFLESDDVVLRTTVVVSERNKVS